jgi:hypothetical protein
LTATVRSANTSDGTPTGGVDFVDTTTGIDLGSAPLSGGSAALATRALAVGSHTITATYQGDSKFAFSLSTSSQAVTQDSSNTTVRSSASTFNFGQAVTLTAAVTPNAPGAGAPTGSVDFLDVTTGTDLTPGGLPLASGSATFSTASLLVGTHTVKALYSGDGDFLPSNGAASTITINPSVIVLDPAAGGALSLSGNASVNIAGGVYVDSSSSSALAASGNAQVNASVIDVVGQIQKGGNARFSPAPVTGAAIVADPLASLALPGTFGRASYGPESLSGNSSATINPGAYTKIAVSGNAKLTLNSGTYIIEGGGISVSENASVSGPGVTIVNAGSAYPSAGGTYGSISFSGNSSCNLSAPASGIYAGIVIFQTLDDSRALTLSGNTAGLTGVVYAPGAQLALSGNAQLNSAVVADTITVSVNAVASAVSVSSPSGTVAGSPGQILAAFGLPGIGDSTDQAMANLNAFDDASVDQALDDFESAFGRTASGLALYSRSRQRFVLQRVQLLSGSADSDD